MEQYKKQLSRRIRLMGGITTMGGITVGLLSWLGSQRMVYPSEFMQGFMTSFPLGLLAAWMMLMMVTIIRYNGAMQSEEKLRAMRIKEEDERLKLIREKAGGFGFNLTLCLLSLAGIAACFFSLTVAVTLFAVMVGMSLIKGGLKLYYLRRY